MSLNKKSIQRNKRKLRSSKKLMTKNIVYKAIVFRSLKYTYAQIIDINKGITVVSGSDIKIKDGSRKEKARKMGIELAKAAIEKNVKKIIFDRAGYQYHGRVQMVAEGLREGGLQF
ncbi:50S ribosomal protein L18 [Candidatus Peregrinibacteria bacterium]|nr:50S ribosomal protein L18 [Candidatus Peregrinibacteria bacterium]